MRVNSLVYVDVLKGTCVLKKPLGILIKICKRVQQCVCRIHILYVIILSYRGSSCTLLLKFKCKLRTFFYFTEQSELKEGKQDVLI